MPTNPDQLDHFIAHTGSGIVAVVIPLFGYWNDVPDNALLQEKVLSLVMNRVYSNVHQLYLVFVANPETTENTPGDPTCTMNVLAARKMGGNAQVLPIERNATYPQYVAKGVDFALNETKARFIMVLNPWVLVQEGAIDVLVDRANRGDEAKAISGYDLRPKVSAEQFDKFRDTLLAEEWDISLDFFCMPRFAAEMIKWETGYKTHQFFEHDIAQSLKQFQFAAINYPQAGMFPLDFPWSHYETEDQKQADRAHFTQKWGFALAL